MNRRDFEIMNSGCEGEWIGGMIRDDVPYSTSSEVTTSSSLHEARSFVLLHGDTKLRLEIVRTANLQMA